MTEPSPCPVIWSPHYEVDIGAHVFPTEKYRRVKEDLLSRGVLRSGDLVKPGRAAWDDVSRAHTSEYVEKLRTGDFSPMDQMLLEVPFSRELRTAFLHCCQGTILAGSLALRGRAALHLGGGFHHAFPDHGEGFCLVNDVGVALRTLLDRRSLSRAAVVDLDVHQGNGTAAVFADDPRVFTLSLHQERNYPHPKRPGDLDVGLPDGVRDAEYLDRLDDALETLWAEHDPELVYYLAGADPFGQDQLGGLGLSRMGLEERDRRVLRRCREEGAAVAILLAGGYARRLEDTVAIHARTVEVTLEEMRCREE